MNARKWMLGTTAAALVAAGPLTGLPLHSFTSTAAAATDVSVSLDFNLFYDRLDPYGDWVSYENAYVWVPTDVSADWRPYTRGHWVYTREYGWLWASDEPFGWATYHYGRWGHAEDIGWYWVPARRWAPAWVAWRRSDNYLAWAPLPPDDGVRIFFEINFDVDRMPRNYWVAVESDRFLDRDISRVAVYDERIIEQARPVGTVVVQNNTVINNAIEVKYIEQKTNKRVDVREAKSVNNPERTGKPDGDAITVFKEDAQGDEKAAKPKKSPSSQRGHPRTQNPPPDPAGGQHRQHHSTCARTAASPHQTQEKTTRGRKREIAGTGHAAAATQLATQEEIASRRRDPPGHSPGHSR